MMKELFVGKVVHFWPTHNCYCYGRILDINEHGVIFKTILKKGCEKISSEWRPGNIRFETFSSKLAFELVKDQEIYSVDE